MKRFGVFLAACFAGVMMGSAAYGETIQIAAPGFTAHDTPTVAGQFGQVFQGLLLNAQGSFYAPVVFPTTGQFVCRFSLIYRDNDTDIDLAARLFRKTFTIGGIAFTPPVLMAQVSSSGTGANVRRATTATIAQSQINNTNSFYYVELEYPGATLEGLGVQIVVKPAC